MNKLKDQLYDTLIRDRLAGLSSEVHGPVFAAAVWIAGVVGFFDLRDSGWSGVLAPLPLVLAAVGALAVWTAGRAWVSRTKSLILVARFASVGGERAAREADALRDRVMRALEECAGNLENPVQVRPLSQVVDVRGGAAAALRRARSSRAAVVVAGTVRSDPGGRCLLVHVLTRGQRTLLPLDRTERKLPFDIPPEDVALGFEEVPAEAANLSRLALGLTLMREGRLEDADRVLRPNGGHISALALFYGALVAYLRDDYEAALERASLSFQAFPWKPSASLASLAAFELGNDEAGITLFKLQAAEGVAPAGPEWDWRIQALTPMAVMRAITAQSERIALVMEAGEVAMELHQQTVAALAADLSGDDEQVVQLLTPIAGTGGLIALSMLACAEARLVLPGAAGRAAAAEKFLASGPRTGPSALPAQGVRPAGRLQRGGTGLGAALGAGS